MFKYYVCSLYDTFTVAYATFGYLWRWNWEIDKSNTLHFSETIGVRRYSKQMLELELEIFVSRRIFYNGFHLRNLEESAK